MPGHQERLTGWQKHFNSVTLRGRANSAALTLTGLAMAVVGYKIRTKAVNKDEENTEKAKLDAKYESAEK